MLHITQHQRDILAKEVITFGPKGPVSVELNGPPEEDTLTDLAHALLCQVWSECKRDIPIANTRMGDLLATLKALSIACDQKAAVGYGMFRHGHATILNPVGAERSAQGYRTLQTLLSAAENSEDVCSVLADVVNTSDLYLSQIAWRLAA